MDDERTEGGHSGPPDEKIAVTSAFPPRETAVGGYLEPIRAAGALLWRDAREREVVLVHRPDRDDWSLPKGKLKNGEHPVAAAVREVAEETGLHPVLGRRLPPQRYLKDGWPKQVEWWAATPRGQAPAGTAGSAASVLTPTGEVDRAEWVPLGEARERLTYEHDVQVLDNFRAGPARTFPVIVFRHLSAGRKRSWNGHDLLRPLDESGRADALALPRILAAFGTPRAISSAAARCTESLLPYTVDLDADLSTERAFTVRIPEDGAVWYDRAGARQALVRILDEGRPTVVCTHGELVADLMSAALTRLGAPLSQQLTLGKGMFWVIHVSSDGGGLAGVERHGVRA